MRSAKGRGATLGLGGGMPPGWVDVDQRLGELL